MSPFKYGAICNYLAIYYCILELYFSINTYSNKIKVVNNAKNIYFQKIVLHGKSKNVHKE